MRQTKEERLMKNLKKIVEEVNYNIAYEKRKAALIICENAVDAFYSDYSPHMYHRKGSLYEAYKVEINRKGDFSFQLGHEFMTKQHRVDNEYIYDYMFVLGWHGGANGGEGHPDLNISDPKRRRLYWRQPPYDVTEVDEYGETTNVLIKKWSLWDVNPAARMRSYNEAPYQRIKREWNNYIKNELEDMQMKELVGVLKKYVGGK